MSNGQRDFTFDIFLIRSCSMHNGVMERSSSRGRISRQLSSNKIISECCVPEKKPSQPLGRDSFQQDSLRGSSTPNIKQSIEKYKKGELQTQSSEARLTSAARESGSRNSVSPRRRRYVSIMFDTLLRPKFILSVMEVNYISVNIPS